MFKNEKFSNKILTNTLLRIEIFFTNSLYGKGYAKPLLGCIKGNFELLLP